MKFWIHWKRLHIQVDTSTPLASRTGSFFESPVASVHIFVQILTYWAGSCSAFASTYTLYDFILQLYHV